MSVKNTGVILFFITILSLLVTDMDNIPMVGTISKFRYLYLVFIWSALLMYKPYWHKRVCLIMGLFTGYILLFGYAFTNPLVADITHNHAKEMVMYILFSFGTAHFIKMFDARNEFLMGAGSALCLFVFWAYLTHPSGIAIIRYVFIFPKIILIDAGDGISYGTIAYNAIANIITTAMWFWLLIYSMSGKTEDVLRFRNSQKSLAGVALMAFLFAMLCTTTSRGELISFFLGGMIWIAMIWRVYIGNKSNRAVQNLIIEIVYIALLLFFCKNILFSTSAGRTDNWAVNWECFKDMGRYYTGMGFVNPWSFLMKSFPGYRTYACDVYWYYLFFSTGILGCIIIFVILAILFISILKHKTDNYLYDCSIKIMVPILIFNNFFHATLFSYNYICSVFVFTFLLEYLME